MAGTIPNNNLLRAFLEAFLDDVRGHPEMVWELCVLRGRGGEERQAELTAALAEAMAFAPDDGLRGWTIGSNKLGDVCGTSTCHMVLAGLRCEITFLCNLAVARGRSDTLWPMAEPYCLCVHVVGPAE